MKKKRRPLTTSAKATIIFNALLIAALPAFETLIAALPQLQSYLPDNVYRTVGLTAVIGNILINSYRAGAAAVEASEE